jgi:hypothetical protein
MKTEDLIRALAADAATADPPIGRTLAVSIAAGIIASVAILYSYLGIRTDLAEAAAHSWHLPLKLAFTVLLAVPAYMLVQRLARPDGDVRTLWPLLAVAPAVLLIANAYEAFSGALGDPAAVIMVPNWTMCVTYIPLLSIAPLAATLVALKQGAPADPTLAGAVGGLLSGALGALLYGTFCDADSPLFVSVWYGGAIIAMSALGALIGSRLLKW